MWKNFILILTKLEELERFLNISIPILIFKLFHVIYIYYIESIENFEIGEIREWFLEHSNFKLFRVISIENFEKLYFDSHEIGKIERIGEILECFNSNISFQELYFDSHGIGGIR